MFDVALHSNPVLERRMEKRMAVDIRSRHASCGVEGAVPVRISLQCFVARVADKILTHLSAVSALKLSSWRLASSVQPRVTLRR